MESCHWNSPVVDYGIICVGWAQPTFDRGCQQSLVGKAHPTIGIFCSVRVKTAGKGLRLTESQQLCYIFFKNHFLGSTDFNN